MTPAGEQYTYLAECYNRQVSLSLIEKTPPVSSIPIDITSLVPLDVMTSSLFDTIATCARSPFKSNSGCSNNHRRDTPT